jgi:hypothetical protein
VLLLPNTLIDFLALRRWRPSAGEIAALTVLHRDIASQTPWWAERIEGGYIWESMLSSLEPPSNPRPYINGGAMWTSEPVYGQEWTMNLFVLYERGVALFGPAAADVFPSVTMRQMRQASLRALHEEWEPLLADDSLLDDPIIRHISRSSMLVKAICCIPSSASPNNLRDW